jgi:hypothetical protein
MENRNIQDTLDIGKCQKNNETQYVTENDKRRG